MVSKIRLLGSGILDAAEKVETAEKKKVSKSGTGWPKRLYHANMLKGKVFDTLEEQEEQFKLGWVESPVDIGKEVITSKIDLSGKGKGKKKGKK